MAANVYEQVVDVVREAFVMDLEEVRGNLTKLWCICGEI